MTDMKVSCRVFRTATNVEPIHDSCLSSLVSGMASGKLKMSFKVGEHNDTMTGGGSNSAILISADSTCGGFLEAVTCVAVRKAEESAGTHISLA